MSGACDAQDAQAQSGRQKSGPAPKPQGVPAAPSTWSAAAASVPFPVHLDLPPPGPPAPPSSPRASLQTPLVPPFQPRMTPRNAVSAHLRRDLSFESPKCRLAEAARLCVSGGLLLPPPPRSFLSSCGSPAGAQATVAPPERVLGTLGALAQGWPAWPPEPPSAGAGPRGQGHAGRAAPEARGALHARAQQAQPKGGRRRASAEQRRVAGPPRFLQPQKGPLLCPHWGAARVAQLWGSPALEGKLRPDHKQHSPHLHGRLGPAGRGPSVRDARECLGCSVSSRRGLSPEPHHPSFLPGFSLSFFKIIFQFPLTFSVTLY